MMDIFQKMSKDEQQSLLRYTSTVFWEALVWKLTEGKINRLEKETLAFVKKFATVVTLANIETLSKCVEKALFYLSRNANAKTLFT